MATKVSSGNQKETITTKITTTETVSSSGGMKGKSISGSDMSKEMLPDINYQSMIGPRESFVRNSIARGSVNTGGRTIKIVSEQGANPISEISPAMGADAASSILESREREKKDMQQLNNRLGAFIEKVRVLELQNRKLVEELEAMRGSWGKDTAGVKSRYVAELKALREKIDDVAREKCAAEVKVARLQQQASDMRFKYEDAQELRNREREQLGTYNLLVSNATDEIGQLQKRLKGLGDELKSFANNSKLEQDIAQAVRNLDDECVTRLDAQNRTQTLMEELEFMRRIHDQEIRELERLMSQDTMVANKDHFKNELALAIRDIRHEYDTIAKRGKNEMESWYKLKVQEVSKSSVAESSRPKVVEEIKRLREQFDAARSKMTELEGRNALLTKQLQELSYQIDDGQRNYESALNDRDMQIRRMREETQALMFELQALMDSKQTLDAEIAIYRRMLEGEESRVGLKGLIEEVVSKHTTKTETEKESSSGGEISQKVRFQRFAKGDVSIGDSHADAKCITLENTNRSKEEKMEGWKLSRKIDDSKEKTFTFPKGFTLPAGQSVKIWAKGAQGAVAGPRSLIFEESNTWGVGKKTETVLRNQNGEERATHTQTTVEVIS